MSRGEVVDACWTKGGSNGSMHKQPLLKDLDASWSAKRRGKEYNWVLDTSWRSVSVGVQVGWIQGATVCYQTPKIALVSVKRVLVSLVKSLFCILRSTPNIGMFHSHRLVQGHSRNDCFALEGSIPTNALMPFEQ